MKPLRQRWAAFLSIAGDPYFSLAALFTLALYIASIKTTDKIVTALLTALTVSLGGVAVNIWTKRYLDLTEEGLLVARGRSAIRGLHKLLNDVAALGQRVQQFHADVPKDQDGAPFLRTRLEEIIGRCNLLAESAVDSIEDWADVIPSADVRSQIGMLTNLESELKRETEERGKLKAELEASKGKSKEDMESLKRQIQKKDGQIAELRGELRSARDSARDSILGSPLSGGVTTQTFTSRDPSIASHTLTVEGPKTNVALFSALGLLGQHCEGCGKIFNPPSSSLSSTGTLSIIPRKRVSDLFCSDCRAQDRQN